MFLRVFLNEFGCTRFSLRNKFDITVFKKAIMPYYAVARGRSVGVYESWDECREQVHGYSGARFKKFNCPQSARAFIRTESGNPPQRSNYYNYRVQYHAAPPNYNRKRGYSSSSGDSSSSDDCNGPSEPKIPARTNRSFSRDNEGYVNVYTDGACSRNGQIGARAGIGIYWAEDHYLNTSEAVSGRATNNCGEIQAATRAIKQALDNGITKLAINTDSKFLIQSVNGWMPAWKRRGWKLKSGEPVKNEKDFRELDSIQNKLQIKWNYVAAHSGVHGNEMADQLARAGASKYSN